MKASSNLLCFLIVFFTLAQFLQAQQRVSSIKEDNPNLPTELSFLQDLTLPSGWGTDGASTDGRYLYVPVQNRELQVYDMSDPSSPKLISDIPDAGSPGTLLEGSFYHNKMLYFTDSGKKLYVYDCSDPTNLVLKNTTSVEGTIRAMSFNGNYAYALMPFPTGLTGKSRFTIFDISNPQTPIKKSSVDIDGTGGGGKNLHLSANRNLVYIKSNTNNTNGLITILDVSNPQSPIISSTTNRTMTYDDLILGYGDYFIASQINNKKTILHVYSTTNPINPQLIKSYELPGSKEIKGMTDIEGTILVYCWPFNSKTISTFYYDKEINEFTAGPEITDTKGWGTHDFVILKEPIARLGKFNKSINNNSIQDYSSNTYYAVYANGSPPVRVIKLEYQAESFTITTDVQPDDARLSRCLVEGGGVYAKDQTATLTAHVPTSWMEWENNWVFDSWSGDISSNDNPINIVVEKNMHIIANFSYLPDPPSLLSVNMVETKPPDTSATVITIKYKDESDNEDGFKVERQINEEGWKEIGTTEENITTYEDTDTELEGTYSYRVCAYNSVGNSDYSNIAIVEVKKTTIPNAPSLLSVNMVETKPPDTAATVITIKYKDESDNEDGFKVERQINEEGWKEIGTTKENITTYEDTDTELEGTYSYRVCAYNSVGNSDYSNIAIVEVKKTTIPNAPSLLSVNMVETKPPDTAATVITIKYKDESDNEDGFKVERQINEEGWKEIGTTKENITTYEDTDTELEGTYSYRVCAYNSVGNSDYSNIASVEVKKTTIPNAPTGLTVHFDNPNPDGVDTLAWVITIEYKDNSDNEDGFKVERQINEEGWNEFGATEENITTYEDTDTELEGTYSYRVCAYNSAGKSDYSNTGTILVTKIQDDNSIPVKYTMLQNFPNPFNPTTVISYSLPLISRVSLIVYDVLGREVAVLVNREQLPGNYKVEFNAGKFASGIYIYRINAGKFSDAKKLILIK